MAIFVILAIMANLVMDMNMAIMDVFLKKSKYADQTRKPFVNWSNSLKVMAKTKKLPIFWPFPFYFGPIFQLACGTP